MPSFADDPRSATRQSPVTAATFSKGEVLARKYRIEKVLGRGGMGHVFAALHVDLDQMVAVKVMHKDLLDDADAVMRFAREAKAAAAIRGNHAARIYDVGKLDTGQPYMVMEYLEGRDLASLVDTGAPIAIPDALEWIAQACEAVAEAHELGIVHRDIKPHNLFLTRDRNGQAVIKVLDFGLAKALTPEKAGSLKESTSMGQIVLGSPFFMSPEQAMARKVDHRTDVWSLASTLYTLLAGVPPFNAPSVNEVCAKLLTEDPPPIATYRPDAPPGLDTLLRRCMTREVDARLGTVRELLAALRTIQKVGPSSQSSMKTAPLLGATMRMPSPSWNNIPVTPPPSNRGTLPMNAFPGAAAPARARASKGASSRLLIALSLAFLVATAVIAGVAIHFIR